MEFIDEIHGQASDQLNKGMPLLNDNLGRWVRFNEKPCHMDKSIRMALLDQRRKEEKQENQVKASRFVT